MQCFQRPLPAVWLAMLGLLFLAIAPAALAADDDEESERFDREGPYVFLGAVAGLEDGKATASDIDHSGGVSVGLGFRPVPLVAFELQGEWIDFSGANQGSVGINLKVFPLSFGGANESPIQPYAIGAVGFGWNDVDSNNPGGHFRIGAGSEFYLTPDLALFVQGQYVGQGGDAADLRYGAITLGALLRF